MQSFTDIRDDFLAYANSQNLEGVAVEKLCNLLAYSAYKNQILQASTALEASFSTAMSLNSRIHHAANLQYSVPRGKCPVVKVENIMSLQTTTYEHLDYIMPFNGYHFYLDLSDTPLYSKSVTKSTIVDGGLNLICSSYKLQTTSAVATSDDIYFIDFVEATNASSDFILYKDVSGVKTRVEEWKVTEDSSQFYLRGNTLDAPYVYDYLAVTIPDYGIRIIRHAEEPWQCSSMTLNYIPYNETTPNFTELKTITGFSLIEDSSTSPPTFTTLDVIPFESRLENLDKIYANAVSSFLKQGNVATPNDLLVSLVKYDPFGAFKIWIDKRIDYTPSTNTYQVVSDGTYATVVYRSTTSKTYGDVQRECVNGFINSFSVNSNIVVVPAKAKSLAVVPAQAGYPVKLAVEAYSASKLLTNDALSNIVEEYKTRIGENLNHSQFEADIVKLGFDYVKVYDVTESGIGGETKFDIQCDIYEFPNIEAMVKQ